ncbi:hypothetical protein [Amycolatopsis xylanica]|uniref:hypothetical protein n=1 Tax=Amycolatopsis xylanica TaxID=589385 RepID=UPI0024820A24|nr:hypothetical protein [Amycolatopsis xylanica]
MFGSPPSDLLNNALSASLRGAFGAEDALVVVLVDRVVLVLPVDRDVVVEVLVVVDVVSLEVIVGRVLYPASATWCRFPPPASANVAISPPTTTNTPTARIPTTMPVFDFFAGAYPGPNRGPNAGCPNGACMPGLNGAGGGIGAAMGGGNGCPPVCGHDGGPIGGRCAGGGPCGGIGAIGGIGG